MPKYTHAGLCLTIRQGLTRAYNAILGADQLLEHPTTKNALDSLEKSIDALDKLERAYNAAGLMSQDINWQAITKKLGRLAADLPVDVLRRLK